MSRLAILMYHSISKHPEQSKGLIVSAEALESQFAFLSENGYQTLHFSELEKFDKTNPLPKKSVIITFDDVYVNQKDLAYPMLKKYNLKATFFIPFHFVGGVDSWNTNSERIMTVDDLRNLDPSVIELGLHSYRHGNYAAMSDQDVHSDFKACTAFIENNQLQVNQVLAYPFGKYPRKNPEKNKFFNILESHNIQYGLRIGNRINTFPFKNNFEIQRIDIKGEDSLNKFKRKLKFGKLSFF